MSSEIPETTQLSPGDECIRAATKRELPKREGYSPVKVGLWWYLGKLELGGKWGDAQVMGYLLVDPRSYYPNWDCPVADRRTHL